MKLHKEGYVIMGGTALLLLLINWAVRYFIPELVWLHWLVLIASIIFFFLIVQFFPGSHAGGYCRRRPRGGALRRQGGGD